MAMLDAPTMKYERIRLQGSVPVQKR